MKADTIRIASGESLTLGTRRVSPKLTVPQGLSSRSLADVPRGKSPGKS
jgi:hypothetical protein